MIFKVLHSSKAKKLNLFKYLVKWDVKVSRGGKKNFGAFQYNVKQLLRKYWEDDLVLEEMSVPAIKGEGGKSLDLVNITKSIIVEVQGDHHNKMGWMHKDNEDFRKQLANDSFKIRWAELNGFSFHEIYEDDELDDELLRKLNII